MRLFYLQFAMLNVKNLQIWSQKCSACEKSRQITANAEIHGKRQNSRYPWIYSWFRSSLTYGHQL